MMSLWGCQRHPDVRGDPTHLTSASISFKSFWQHSGSFTQHRFSLVPSSRSQIEVHGKPRWLYFECHDVGNFDLLTGLLRRTRSGRHPPQGRCRNG